MDTKYCYPGTNVLINNYGIKDFETLEAVERDFTAKRAIEISEKGSTGKTRSDFARLKTIHKKLFGDLYSWAGKIRTVDISKGNSMFCNASFIEPMAEDIFRKLQKDNALQGMEKEPFIERLAYYMGEINALHPFREGNGRTQRFFFEELSERAGYDLDFTKADKLELLNADIAAMHQSTDRLKTVLASIVDHWDAPKQKEKASIQNRIEALKKDRPEPAKGKQHEPER